MKNERQVGRKAGKARWTMSERARLARDLGDASERRHQECRRVLDWLDRAREAVLAVQRGEPGATARLSDLCHTVSYDGSRLCCGVDALLSAGFTREAALASLQGLDAAEGEDAAYRERVAGTPLELYDLDRRVEED